MKYSTSFRNGILKKVLPPETGAFTQWQRKMKGITLVAFYYQLGIILSFSRPRVSDDNPYIESFFKGVKHICGYPSCFRTIDGARRWFADFIDWYNNSHLHSGLLYVTPAQKRSEPSACAVDCPEA